MSRRVTERIAKREAELKARTAPKPTYPEEVAQAASDDAAPAPKPKRTKKN